MDADRKAAERARLERYIADSVRRRRRLGIAFVPAVVVALGLMPFAPQAGLIALVLAVIVLGTGLWITTSHVVDMRARVAELSARGARTVRRRHHGS